MLRTANGREWAGARAALVCGGGCGTRSILAEPNERLARAPPTGDSTPISRRRASPFATPLLVRRCPAAERPKRTPLLLAGARPTGHRQDRALVRTDRGVAPPPPRARTDHPAMRPPVGAYTYRWCAPRRRGLLTVRCARRRAGYTAMRRDVSQGQPGPRRAATASGNMGCE